MTYLLFFVSIGLATALALLAKQLQRRKNDYAVVEQRLKETDKRLSCYAAKFNKQHYLYF
ncbi:hypothetical protein [Nostoc sp. JL33]|uniref:hypothetical protein n=1 Tax=Nostoc sp. JL33 TaxID=2815396 RepID=UPI0025F5203A|nr:hypothetical protein [Nostoc sp. JL33]MBN3871384.1 hypothetical protein [Nostoc sp. JL33]